jgi:hypothetical protein
MNATPWYARPSAVPQMSRRGFLWLGAGAATVYLSGCGGGEGIGGGEHTARASAASRAASTPARH